ncbi:retrovirus-related pol polyprotein from transposon TNT 1-94 [Tanacetum coccineum]|uniref:Retrovirus-related pol polyprotein from transposon TNT 1-94 n=1 Tax=Tanacetum coccineum TaxID=301880 RepID=A0ABQ5G9G5_9ASTR
MDKDKIKQDFEEIKTIDIELDHREKALAITSLKDELRKLKGKALVDNNVSTTYVIPEEEAAVLKDLVDHIKANYPLDLLLESTLKQSTSASGLQPSGNTKKDKIQQTQSKILKNKHSKLNANPDLKCVKCYGCMLSDNHDLCVLDFINNVNARAKSRSVKKNSKRKVWKPTRKVFTNIGYIWRPTGWTFTIVGNACPLTRITTTTEVPLRKSSALDNKTPSRPNCSLGFDSGCSMHMTGDRSQLTNFVNKFLGDNIYTLSLGNMMASSPICLLSKASKTKSWLWHRRLSHLNFRAINYLARHGLVRGLPKLKFEKDHLCSACALGKSTKKPHKPKSEDTNQEKLYLLHMDMCGPMRVASVNGKKYIFVIVDDYSRFTWVKCLRSKDKVAAFIINFLRCPSTDLGTHLSIRTDNGTEFVNQTLREYYEKVGISHETSVARSPQQNDVVERRNRTLIEAAHTMLIYAKAPLFHGRRVTAACYTKYSMIVLTFRLITIRASATTTSNLWVASCICALCYPTNDSKNLGKLQPKADIGIFIGYAPIKKAFWIYNKRTRRIVETIHVDFDELTAMASEHSSSGPALHEITPVTITPKVIALDIADSTTTVDQDAPSLIAHMGNDPYFSVLIPEVSSDQPSSSDTIHTISEIRRTGRNYEEQSRLVSPVVTIGGGIDLRVCCPRLQISQNPKGIFINQSKYALKSLKKYGFDSCDLVDTPMVEKSKLDEDKEGKAVDPSHYRGLAYQKALKCDANHAGCQDTHRSTSGSMQLLGDRLVSWSSKRQKSTAISSTEAEYIALSGCCAQILWMRSQLTDYDFGFNKIPMYYDNKSAIALCCNNFYVGDSADIFTKALGRERIEFLINKLGMRSFTPETLKQLADEVDE